MPPRKAAELKSVKIQIDPLIIDHSRDEPGTIPEGIVTVPLDGKQSEGKSATLLLSDFAEIVREHGFFLNWIANSSESPDDPDGKFYVRAYSKRRGDVVQVAWLLLDIWKGQGRSVRYLDGNPLNLIRSNLKVIERGAHVESH